jgi:sortase A
MVRRRVETALLLLGSLLLAVFFVGLADSALSVRAEMASFNNSNQQRISASPEQRHSTIDFSYWSKSRVSAYLNTLAVKLPAPLALLRIPKVNLEVPVLEGSGALVLNRGVGHIVGTAHPGEFGNIGIAGHRDSFFRVLQHVDVGDRIDLQTPAQVFHYQVSRITIVDPMDVTVLRPQPNPSLTLITCYPFHFLGSAPKRYVVVASMAERSVENATLVRVQKSSQARSRTTNLQQELQTVNERSPKEKRQ